VDPFAGVLGAPGTQHPYGYGLNNPLTYADPSGKSVLLVGTILVVGVITSVCAEIFFNQLPSIVRQYGGTSQTLQAIQCGGLGVIWDKIDKAALIGAATNALVGGLLALGAAALVPFLIGEMGLVGGWVILTSIVGNTFLGGLSGMLGGMAGTTAEWLANGGLKNGTPLRFDPEQLKADFVWAAGFSFIGSAAEEIMNRIAKPLLRSALQAQTQEFRAHARSIVKLLLKSGVPDTNPELAWIRMFSMGGTSARTVGAHTTHLYIYVLLETTFKVVLNDNYWSRAYSLFFDDNEN